MGRTCSFPHPCPAYKMTETRARSIPSASFHRKNTAIPLMGQTNLRTGTSEQIFPSFVYLAINYSGRQLIPTSHRPRIPRKQSYPRAQTTRKPRQRTCTIKWCPPGRWTTAPTLDSLEWVSFRQRRTLRGFSKTRQGQDQKPRKERAKIARPWWSGLPGAKGKSPIPKGERKPAATRPPASDVAKWDTWPITALCPKLVVVHPSARRHLQKAPLVMWSTAMWSSRMTMGASAMIAQCWTLVQVPSCQDFQTYYYVIY